MIFSVNGRKTLPNYLPFRYLDPQVEGFFKRCVLQKSGHLGLPLRRAGSIMYTGIPRVDCGSLNNSESAINGDIILTL